MARYTGPTCRLSRREGTDLLLKSRTRPLDSKCKIDSLPGQHGTRRQRRSSDYAIQLREKQKLRRIYGVLERQFRNYYRSAARKRGATGENLLKLLECRLDNVVYRMGFASTRAEARQARGPPRDRGQRTRRELRVLPGERGRRGERPRTGAPTGAHPGCSLSVAEQYGFPDWVETDVSKMEGVFKSVPERQDLPPDISEQLVVELYSK